jgi:DNA segregation ATPase FtsK/SpoIIIE, S-DNA-T family
MAKKRKSTKRRRVARRNSSRLPALESLELKDETRRHISGFVQIALSVLFFLVLQGAAGMAGEVIGKALAFFFGSGAIVLPAALLISGLLFLFGKENHLELRAGFGLGICLIAILGIIHIQAPFDEIGVRRDELGGAIGFMAAFPLLAFTSIPVAYTVLSSLLIVGVLITFEMNISDILGSIVNLFKKEEEEEEAPKRRKRKSSVEDIEDMDAIEEGMDEVDEKKSKKKKKEEEAFNIVRPVFLEEGSDGKVKNKKSVKKKKAQSENDDEIEMKDTRFDDWEFPSLDCLDPGRSEVMVDDVTLQKQAKLIEEKLQEFDVTVKVREAHPGPTVTQFALEPSEGIKLSRIANLKSDLALALAAPSLRIEAPIPGKSLVGIEMPNEKRTIVHLREILESSEFRESESSLSLPFGRDVSGKAIVHDLSEMPHLLIAGATGSGKSVCMNTFLTSLLFQNAPHELKFILIDPKRVELSLYDGIPHLLTPVITESEKALKALRWVVAEMGRRLARFSEVGARNLKEFNNKHDDEKHLPRIVVVIDELADLMMRQYRRDTEMMITRIAQIARATGIHLIVATQRPSVDVITGIIKANIPSRVAFRTVSSIDSRTILDGIGSEDLLGKGDLLYTMAHTPMPVRVQGIYVSSSEVEKVINKIKIAGGGALTAEIKLGDSRDSDEYGESEDSDDEDSDEVIDLDADDDGGDTLTFEAIDIVKRSGKASASLLQRHLKVGYARAARILDIMEEKGVIGPGEGAKPRKVYVE